MVTDVDAILYHFLEGEAKRKFVRFCARRAWVLGVDASDVEEYMMQVLWEAAKSYDVKEGVDLEIFIFSCLRNRMLNFIRELNNEDRKIIISVEEFFKADGYRSDEYDVNFKEWNAEIYESPDGLCGYDSCFDSVDSRLDMERLVKLASTKLSDIDYQVFVYLVMGFSCMEIAHLIGYSREGVRLIRKRIASNPEIREFAYSLI